MVSFEAALAIGMDPSKSNRHIEIATANGIIFAPVIIIPSVQCFGVQIKNSAVACHNLPSESPVEGLLGLDFLKAAKLVLDFDQNRVWIRR